MRRYRLLTVSMLLATLPAAPVSGQAGAPGDRPGWRLGLGGGVFRVDDLVGTPFVPLLSVGGSVGRRGYVGLDLSGFFNQGFYSATALTGDLDVGIRFPLPRFEVVLSAGPSGMLGGDSDGTPYTAGGGHAAAAGTAWLGDRVGLTGRFRARWWQGTAEGLLPGAWLGLVVRLQNQGSGVRDQDRSSAGELLRGRCGARQQTRPGGPGQRAERSRSSG
jgi:hypothetical protein